MLDNLSNSFKKFSFFREIIEENNYEHSNESLSEIEESEDTDLFKIPKYLETVLLF